MISFCTGKKNKGANVVITAELHKFANYYCDVVLTMGFSPDGAGILFIAWQDT